MFPLSGQGTTPANKGNEMKISTSKFDGGFCMVLTPTDIADKKTERAVEKLDRHGNVIDRIPLRENTEKFDEPENLPDQQEAVDLVEKGEFTQCVWREGDTWGIAYRDDQHDVNSLEECDLLDEEEEEPLNNFCDELLNEIEIVRNSQPY